MRERERQQSKEERTASELMKQIDAQFESGSITPGEYQEMRRQIPLAAARRNSSKNMDKQK